MSEDGTGKDSESGKSERELIDHARRQVEDARQRREPTATSPPGDTGAAETAPPSDSIEGYEILSEVHRGGQGVVYKAVQKATKRTVALKVLLEGPYASPRQRHRFEREIDLVAGLQHPNIVTVYDSGVTRDGRHYFAMEYIHGQPLDAYLSDKYLGVDETLRLFQQICAAVNHAHQHGVIHRDLKPGNIRVDANGEPHVLDFGLAKIAVGEATDGIHPQVMTMTGQFIGSLPWASPDEGLQETLTLHRLGVFKELGRSFKMTNCIENLNALIGQRTGKVDCWGNADQKRRWLATALLEIEPRLRKVCGYRALPRLRAALQAASTGSLEQVA